MYKCDGTYEKFWNVFSPMVNEPSNKKGLKSILQKWEKNKNDMKNNWNLITETIKALKALPEDGFLINYLCALYFGENLIGTRTNSHNQIERYKMDKCDPYYMLFFENYIKESNPHEYEILKKIKEQENQFKQEIKSILLKIYNYSLDYEQKSLGTNKVMAFGGVVQNAIIASHFTKNAMYPLLIFTILKLSKL